MFKIYNMLYSQGDSPQKSELISCVPCSDEGGVSVFRVVLVLAVSLVLMELLVER